MLLDMFSVYDVKAKTYCTPFFSENISTAIRGFAYAANEKTTDIGRYPEDYCLYHLGHFDTNHCKTTLQDPLMLSTALALIKPTEVL